MVIDYELEVDCECDVFIDNELEFDCERDVCDDLYETQANMKCFERCYKVEQISWNTLGGYSWRPK